MNGLHHRYLTNNSIFIEAIEDNGQHFMEARWVCKFNRTNGMYWRHIFAVMNTLQIKWIQKFKPYSRWSKEAALNVYKVKENIHKYQDSKINRFELPSSNPQNGMNGFDSEYWWKSWPSIDDKIVTTIDMTQDEIWITESKPSKRLDIFNKLKNWN